MTGRDTLMGPTEREVEQWKESVRLDIAEERNPGTDEFAKGFNGGLTKARDMIYARLPQLFAAEASRLWNTRSPVCEDAREVVEALEEAGRETYRQGYRDGHVDALYPEGAPVDEFEAWREIDGVAIGEGWTNYRDTFCAALAKTLPPLTEMTSSEAAAEILRLNRRAIELEPLAGWYLKIRIEDAPPLPGGGL